MTIAVLLASVVKDDRAAAELVRAADFVVAADGGASHAARLGLRVDVLAGDFDSADPAVLDAMEKDGARVVRVPTAKDETDGELACRLALEEASRRHAESVTLLVIGALGGRTDHEAATILHLAGLAECGHRIMATDGETAIYLLVGPTSLDIVWPPAGHAAEAWYVSSIALKGDVTGLAYTGLCYPLQDFTLPFGSTRGVSNEPADPADARFSVSLKSGLLAVIVTPRRDLRPEEL
ncbi:MAG TPA: thiamine diphosphokinase [Clostridiaceae bacterium]|nr:thiamine diphosphokinase [Clostridiaceae bacterium]